VIYCVLQSLEKRSERKGKNKGRSDRGGEKNWTTSSKNLKVQTQRRGKEKEKRASGNRVVE